MDKPGLRLPRQLETDPHREAIERALGREPRPLWEKGTLNVAHVALTPALEKALVASFVGRHLERGLEHIERLLQNEEKGIAAVREKQGTSTAHRVSRLLVIADGGAERFYRSCEALLFRHADRVLGLRVAVPCEKLAELLFGGEKIVKVLLVSDRDAVSNVLRALGE